MKLYHYSNKSFEIIKTLRNQGKLTLTEIKDLKKRREKANSENIIKNSKYYYDSISFFIDPIPLDIISTIFPKDHHIWFKDSELYMYTVDTSNIGNFMYEVVEFPEKIEIFYDKTITIKEYHRLLKEAIELNNYIGSGEEELKKALKKFVGNTREYFIKIPSFPNYDKIKYKYAPTVPHVMLYPETGQINFINKSIVKIK